MSFAIIPEYEFSEFHELTTEGQAYVSQWIQIARDLGHAEQLYPACKAYAPRSPFAAKTLAKRIGEFRKTGDWRVFIDKRKESSYWQRTGAANSALAKNPVFVDFVKVLVEENQRCDRQAFDQLRRFWQTKDRAIPGYEGWPGWPNLPKGWSDRNLYLVSRASKFERKAMRVGLRAASAHAPKVFTTRANLYVGSHYMFDDLWHDHMVVVGNRGKVGRVLELAALDVFSACKFAYGLKPRLKNDEGVNEGLKEANMRFLVAHVLTDFGYDAERGTELMAEHGTAALREKLERFLYDASGGKITVRRSGITGEEQAVAGMQAGRGLGNFRFKAPLESQHSLVHNVSGSLRGQTGKDVDFRPERLHGELQSEDAILKLMRKLPPERAQYLWHRFIEYHSQFVPLYAELCAIINGRTDHQLEGWSEAGLLTIEYRLTPDSPDWIKQSEFLSLPWPTQEMLLSLVSEGRQDFHRARRLSPLEVHTAARPRLRKINPWIVVGILGEDLGVERICRNGYFTFSDKEVSPSELRFESRIVDRNGRQEELRDRQEFLTFVNPFSPEQLFVSDAKGRYLGVAQRDHRPSRADAKAIQQKHGRVAKRTADLLAPVRQRHGHVPREAIEFLQHNRAVADLSRPFTSEEKLDDQERRELTLPLTAFVAEDGSDPYQPSPEEGYGLAGAPDDLSAGALAEEEDAPVIASMEDFL